METIIKSIKSKALPTIIIQLCFAGFFGYIFSNIDLFLEPAILAGIGGQFGYLLSEFLKAKLFI